MVLWFSAAGGTKGCMRVPAVALAGERSSACWTQLVAEGVEGGWWELEVGQKRICASRGKGLQRRSLWVGDWQHLTGSPVCSRKGRQLIPPTYAPTKSLGRGPGSPGQDQRCGPGFPVQARSDGGVGLRGYPGYCARRGRYTKVWWLGSLAWQPGNGEPGTGLGSLVTTVCLRGANAPTGWVLVSGLCRAPGHLPTRDVDGREVRCSVGRPMYLPCAA